jgi:hypothetical protein
MAPQHNRQSVGSLFVASNENQHTDGVGAGNAQYHFGVHVNSNWRENKQFGARLSKQEV